MLSVFNLAQFNFVLRIVFPGICNAIGSSPFRCGAFELAPLGKFETL